jgi:2-polyprenyl-3-methyl-5-hydroxy-6-metoxy-1,4-benzoquinol methylase
MPINTRQRTSQEEIMDDFSLEGEELREALDKIAAINRWLGGNRVTLNGVKKLLKNHPQNEPITVIDIGCGNGDMCRALAAFGRNKRIQFKILGIDANAFTIRHAAAISTAYPEISYAVMDVFSTEFASLQYDIALCTLTLHHFTDKEILQLMKVFVDKAGLGIVINDLHRSALAYGLFQVICFVFRLNRMSEQDGLISILRGFKRQDLERFSQQLQLKIYHIRWKWAFRYQWIVKTL